MKNKTPSFKTAFIEFLAQKGMTLEQWINERKQLTINKNGNIIKPK